MLDSYVIFWIAVNISKWLDVQDKEDNFSRAICMASIPYQTRVVLPSMILNLAEDFYNSYDMENYQNITSIRILISTQAWGSAWGFNSLFTLGIPLNYKRCILPLVSKGAITYQHFLQPSLLFFLWRLLYVSQFPALIFIQGYRCQR